MAMTMMPIARLITRHGTAITIRRTPAADAAEPWRQRAAVPSVAEVRGIIQRIKPATDPDLTAGSIRAVAVIVLPREIPRPGPGDRLTALDRDWRIETILPVKKHRGAEVIEAVIASPGGTT